MEDSITDSEQRITIPADSAMKEPLVGKKEQFPCPKNKNGGSIWMVLLSTAVSVWGSFVFGVAVSFVNCI
jgi:hypothetical protein